MKYFILCLLIFFSIASKSQSTFEKPNIIFLLSDDQRDNTFSAMGHPAIKTPNADKLIKNGVRFSNTYIAAPVCSPSRVSLLTGMHERIHGVGFSSSYKLTEEQWEKTYPALLRKSGYYTGFVGKFGVEYYTFRGQAFKKFDFWRGHDGWAKFWAKSTKDYADSDEEIITSVTGESIQRFLNAAPSDKPFCLSVSFSVPHGSQITSMYPGVDNDPFCCVVAANENPKLKDNPFYDTLYRNQHVEIPKETATDPYAYIPKRMMDQQKGRANSTYPYDYDIATCREHHIRYYQQISAMDEVIGDMIETLEQKGLSKNTIIIFASDHGLLMGEYGMGGKGLLYDLTSKIPCFVFDPRQPQNRKGVTIDKLVSSLDITATILDYAGVSQPKKMEGSSLVPLVSGKGNEWRDELFLENLFTLRDTPFSEGIVTKGWKYIRMYNAVVPYNEQHVDFTNRQPGFEQLFDLNADPAEMNNLIEDMASSEILKKLRNKTKKYSIQMNKEREVYKKTHEVKSRVSK